MSRRETPPRKPEWLRKKISHDEEIHQVRSILSRLSLHTVCQSARCPNLWECFRHRRATFMILGDRCTRGCRFCSVDHASDHRGLALDEDEPQRLVEAVQELGLRYVVITSVTRDDLPDGGAVQFAACVQELRKLDPTIRVEVLTPDFLENHQAIDLVAETGPDVYNHNVETISRLYPTIRPEADYERSLGLLARVHERYPAVYLKSGIMVGLGEQEHEVGRVFEDLREAGCTAVTVGQYLRPARENIPVVEYITPRQFKRYERMAVEMGFTSVACGPFVRSSYMAHQGFEELSQKPTTRY